MGVIFINWWKVTSTTSTLSITFIKTKYVGMSSAISTTLHLLAVVASNWQSQYLMAHSTSDNVARKLTYVEIIVRKHVDVWLLNVEAMTS